MTRRILLIEDEPGLALTLTDLLVSEGFSVDHATDGPDGEQRALNGNQDLIILDLMLPGKSGLDICRDLRVEGIQTPILMLTARDQLVDKVIGLKMGADDYLTKPFEGIELTARIEALLRRGRAFPGRTRVYRFGNICLDTRSADVTCAGRPLRLSAREFQLLRFFLENEGQLLTRDRLMDEVWGYDTTVNTRTVDVYVAGLRQKIEPSPHNPRFILTIRGLGYKFLIPKH